MRSLLDKSVRLLHFSAGQPKLVRDLDIVAATEVVQKAINDSQRDRLGLALGFERAQLQEQAFAHITRANARRVEGLKLCQHALDALQRNAQRLGGFGQIAAQVAMLIQAAHQILNDRRVFGRQFRLKGVRQEIGQRNGRLDVHRRVKGSVAASQGRGRLGPEVHLIRGGQCSGLAAESRPR